MSINHLQLSLLLWLGTLGERPAYRAHQFFHTARVKRGSDEDRTYFTINNVD